MTGSTDAAGTLADRLAAIEAQNLLVAGPSIGGSAALAGGVVAGATRAGRDALVVTTTGSPGRLVPDPDAGTGRVGVVDCTPGDPPSVGDRATTVPSPGDLTGISIPVSSFLEGDDGSSVVVLDSVSALLQYAEPATVMRFLSVITDRVRHHRGLGLVTVEPDMHEDRTLDALRRLFDARVSVPGDDGPARLVGVEGVPDGRHEL